MLWEILSVHVASFSELSTVHEMGSHVSMSIIISSMAAQRYVQVKFRHFVSNVKNVLSGHSL